MILDSTSSSSACWPWSVFLEAFALIPSPEPWLLAVLPSEGSRSSWASLYAYAQDSAKIHFITDCYPAVIWAPCDPGWITITSLSLSFFPVITLILLGGTVSVKWDKEHICHTESVWLLFKSPSHVWLFCNPMDYSPPNSSIHGISQARILEWVAISFSRGPSQPRDWPCISCIGRRILNRWTTREAQACSRHMGNAARSKDCPVGESTPRRSIPLCWNPASCRYFKL